MYRLRKLLIACKKLFNSSKPKQTADMSHEDYRFLQVIFFSITMGFIGHFLFAMIFAVIGLKPMLLLNIGSVLIYTLLQVLLRKNKIRLTVWIAYFEFVTHAIIAVLIVGWDSGFQYYLFCIVPVVIIAASVKRLGKIVAISILPIVYWGVSLYGGVLTPIGFHAPAGLHAMNVFLVFMSMVVVSLYIHSVTLHNERKLMNINRALGELADTDPLTGFLNRRSMHLLLDSQFKKAKLDGSELTLLMMDLDRFKSINDHYGHVAGDAVLVETAIRLKRAIRDNDAIARWGGEEFLVTLPGVSLEQAAVVAEKLSISLRSEPVDIGDKPTWQTITIGLAGIRPEDTLQDLMERADMALYKGKKAGRNCIMQ